MAFSTMLGWGIDGERGVEYLARNIVGRGSQKKSVSLSSAEMETKLRSVNNAYRIIYLITVYLGAVVSLDLVWNLADIFNALMAFPNLLCLLFLSGVIVKETRKYLWNGSIDEKM